MVKLIYNYIQLDNLMVYEESIKIDAFLNACARNK